MQLSTRSSLITLATIAMLNAAPAAAQSDTVRAGAPGYDSLELPIGTDSSDTYMVRNGERRLLATYVETTSEVAGGYLIVGENIGPDGRSLSLDSVVVARGTLAPVRHSDVTGSGRMSVRFDDGRMTGASIDTAGRETAVDTAVAPGAFDYSMAGRVVNRLPLGPGYETVLLTHDIKRGTIPIGIRVVGEDELMVDGAPVPVWQVEIDYGRFKATRWIGRETRDDLRTAVSVNGNEMIVEYR